jgi:hypothetical protein
MGGAEDGNLERVGRGGGREGKGKGREGKDWKEVRKMETNRG